MAAVMWIEVLSREGHVASRERIDADEARVGRAFDNDLVVDDPHVAPHHLRIFRGEDGVLVAEDLGTVNGLYPEHGAGRAPRIALGAAPGLRIGRTILRVHDAAHAVAPERPLTPPRAHARWALLLALALFALILLLNWLDLTTRPTANAVLLPLLALATALVAWSGFWALLSRVFFGQAQFAVQLRIALTAAIAVVLWDQVAETLSFSLAWRDIVEYQGLGAWALLAATCYAHLRSIGPRHMRAASGLIVALVATGAALQYFGKSETRNLFGQRATLGDLRPPAFRVLPAVGADEFFRRAEDTRRRVDHARTKEPPPGGLLSDMESPE
ncbi:MAG TPA: FHA domain-containing protein [Usitatibacter sp.]|nr:FHA domain-containing protein [Usitatibacter sp.]